MYMSIFVVQRLCNDLICYGFTFVLEGCPLNPLPNAENKSTLGDSVLSQ